MFQMRTTNESNFQHINHLIKVICSFLTSVGQNWPPIYQLDALTTELREILGEQGKLLGSFVTRVLHTDGISNFGSIICVINNFYINYLKH